ncbi:MAG: AMIN domain-containing protein [bacterium]
MLPLLYRRTSAKFLVITAFALALTLVPVAPAAPQANGVLITQVTVKVFGDTVQLTVVGTGPLTYRTLQLSSPPRLVIDLPGALVGPAVPPLIDVERGGVARVRIGQFQDRPAIARVAVDMDNALPFTLATAAPAVLTAKFASRGQVAAALAPAAAPVSAVAAPPPPLPPVAQAPPPAPPPVPGPTPAATPGPGPAQAVPGRITLEFRNSELADVLSALAKACNMNIVTDASVKGTVTVRLVDLSCEESLRFILEANSLGFRRIGRNLIIMSADKLVPPPETPEAITYTIGFGVAKDVADAVRASVPGIRVTQDVRSNQIVVVGTQAQQEEVRKILAGLDIQLSQVVIEARVVDISIEDLNNLGLRWGLTGDPPTNIIQVVGDAAVNQIRVGVATFTIFGAITALIDQKKARVLSAPRVAVLDNNEAEVNLGEEIPIPATDASGRVTFTFKPVGVILKILPKINRDGYVTTKVSPEVSSVITLLQPGNIPRLSTRKATTTVTVRSGESIIIGGLISTQERINVVKVPLLGDIPLVGFLFRYTSVDRRDTEVIFIITPQILPGPGAPVPAATPRP